MPATILIFAAVYLLTIYLLLTLAMRVSKTVTAVSRGTR